MRFHNSMNGIFLFSVQKIPKKNYHQIRIAISANKKKPHKFQFEMLFDLVFGLRIGKKHGLASFSYFWS